MKADEKATLAFGGILALIAALYWLPPERFSTPVRIASIGGFIAFVGVVLMSREVVRTGPFHWIAMQFFKDTDLGQVSEADAKREKDERRTDAFYEKVKGPYLVGIGTVLNGFSGYF